MIVAWLLLLGGRWVIIQWMLTASILNPEVVRGLDNGPLLRAYLILVAVTAAVTVLRLFRVHGPTSAGNLLADNEKQAEQHLPAQRSVESFPQSQSPVESSHKGQIGD